MNTRSLKKHLKYIVPQIRLALIKEPGNKAVPISTPSDIEKLIEPLKHYSEEHFVSFHLNSRNEVSGFHIVSHGTVSASLVHPREVFKSALLTNSHSIIVAHNHPGGSLSPSAEDLETTEKLIESGKILGVPLVDHIIVSHRGYVSLRETRGYFWI